MFSDWGRFDIEDIFKYDCLESEEEAFYEVESDFPHFVVEKEGDIYKHEGEYRAQVHLQRLSIDEIRALVVKIIIEMALTDTEEIHPANSYSSLYAKIEIEDLNIRGFLVSPGTYKCLGPVKHLFQGSPVFVSEHMLEGFIISFTEPDYLGVICHLGNKYGIAGTNTKGATVSMLSENCDVEARTLHKDSFLEHVLVSEVLDF